MRCKICDTPAEVFAMGIVLGKYEVGYFRCANCGFVQTEEPYWLDEARQQPINRTDVGLVSRNLELATVTRTLIRVFLDSTGRFLDWGGGYGLFVRLMRDAGYDFHRYDPHCPNLLALGLDADPGDRHWELITALDVVEHLEDPVGSLRDLLAATDSVLISTELLPSPTPRPSEWWYYGLEHGQHISIFTAEALKSLAKKLDLRLLTDRRNLHLLTRRRIPYPAYALLSKYRISAVLSPWSRRPSLQPADAERLLAEPEGTTAPGTFVE